LLALGMSVTACGTVSPKPGTSDSLTPRSSASARSASAVPASATDLVGAWVVSQGDGVEPGTVLSLGGDLSLWRTCGYLMGAWRAASGLFVGTVYAGDSGCMAHDTIDVPSWLTAAAGVRLDGADRLLVSSSGDVVARLHPGGSPTPGPNLLPSVADPPVLTPDLRSQLAPADPLPHALRPATSSDLVGIWGPVPSTPGLAPSMPAAMQPRLELTAAGDYSASDGCNDTGGRWMSGPEGLVLATDSPTTLVGCNGASVGQWLAAAGRAGLDGEILVLLDHHSHELGRLQHLR
jgi:hypothetical protein